MAHITEEKELLLTNDEAQRFLTNLDGKVRFMVMVEAFLPTNDEATRGFPGQTCITISRKVAKEVVRDMLRGFDKRGAKIRIKCSPPSEYSDLSFVVIR